MSQKVNSQMDPPPFYEEIYTCQKKEFGRKVVRQEYFQDIIEKWSQKTSLIQ
jgi:hypothetical protein